MVIIGDMIDGIRFHNEEDKIRYNEMPSVELDYDEWLLSVTLGANRAMSYIIDGYGEPIGKNIVQVHAEGAIGEMMICKEYGFDIDKTISSWGDGGEDMRIGSITVNVKSNTREKPELLVKKGKTESDIYVLIHIIDEFRGKILGWADRRDVESRDAVLYPTDKIENHVIHWRDLREPHLLENKLSYSR